MKFLFRNQKQWSRFKAIIESWEGTPFRHNTMVKGRGADCTLFVAGVLLEAGILLQVKYDYYPRDWHIHTTDERVLEAIARHTADNMAPGHKLLQLDRHIRPLRGDILVFSTTATGVSNHAAFFMGGADPMIMHAIDGHQVMATPYITWWRNRLTNIFRVVI